LKGHIETVQLLLAQGPDLSILDREHSSTPLGWARWASDYFKDPAGNYPDTIRALVEAGAT
jgi:hypothetical protein